MDVSNDRLRIIGKMIGVYREEKRENTQNSWTQRRFCEDICSPNTLKSIEAGGLSRSVDVYVDLLDKFDLKLGEYPVIDKAIDNLMDGLYDAIEFFDRDKIKKVTSKIIRGLEKVKMIVYYSELYQLFVDLLDYYIKDELISYAKVNRYMKMMYILPIQLQDIYRIIIFAKMKQESTNNKEKFKELVDNIRLDKSIHHCVKINLLHYYFIQNKYIVMNDLIEELENDLSLEDNIVRLLDVYNCSIILFSYIDADKCKIYIKKAENLILNHEFPEIKLGELYSNIATAYYIDKDYEKSLEYYECMLAHQCGSFLINFIYMADCQNRLNVSINIPTIDDNDYLEHPTNVRIMYKYFALDEKIPAFAKENYIIKKILPDLNDLIFIEVFRYELLRLVNITNHYKSIHIFETKVKENLLNRN